MFAFYNCSFAALTFSLTNSMEIQPFLPSPNTGCTQSTLRCQAGLSPTRYQVSDAHQSTKRPLPSFRGQAVYAHTRRLPFNYSFYPRHPCPSLTFNATFEHFQMRGTPSLEQPFPMDAPYILKRIWPLWATNPLPSETLLTGQTPPQHRPRRMGTQGSPDTAPASTPPGKVKLGPSEVFSLVPT